MKRGEAHQTTIEQIEIVKSMIARYPETFELALTSEDVNRIRAAGKIASLIGMEGGHAIENSIAKLRRLHEMGAKYMTLTHSDTLDWADACSDEPKSHGLSEFGREVVREMNRMGMLVISRMSRQRRCTRHSIRAPPLSSSRTLPLAALLTILAMFPTMC